MRLHVLAALAVLTLSYSAYGADFPIKASEAPSNYDWTGFYAGAHLDYQAGQARWSDNRSAMPEAYSILVRGTISHPERVVTQ